MELYERAGRGIWRKQVGDSDVITADDSTESKRRGIRAVEEAAAGPILLQS